MSHASPTARGDFRVGDVLGGAFTICAGNFPFFFIVTLVVSLPSLLTVGGQPQGDVPDTSSQVPMYVLSMLLELVLNTIGEAVILYGAFQWLSGRPLQPREAFQRAIARFLPLLGLALLYGFAVAVAFLLFVVPGVMLVVMWAVIVPACIVEGLGPVQSLSRSADLTKGYRWAIFGIMLLVGLVSAAGTVALGYVLASTGIVVTTMVNLVWGAVWTVYWNCVIVIIYRDLRVAKEGLDTRQIASVFD